jgi:FKBP-type peptidyl-prolyl cis-trans isomerase
MFESMTSTAPLGRARRPLTALSLSLAALLLATACASGDDAPDQDSPSSGAQASASPSSGSADGGEEEDYQRAEAGSGVGQPDRLESVSLTAAGGEEPVVSVDTPLTADEVSTRVLKTNEAPAPQDGDLVTVSTVAVDPEDGEVMGENFSTGPEVVMVNERLKGANEALYEMLRTNPPGAEVAYYIPEQKAPEAEDGQPQGQDMPAALYVFRIDEVLAKQAQGEEVTDLDQDLPAVSVDEETGHPRIEKPSGDAPQELTVQPLIQGEGAEVGEHDQVTVQYTGVTWSEGKTFDSSWERGGDPATFSLDQVITGWKEGLAGQKVGSRVLISIPSDKAYGEAGSPPDIGENEDLLFVVDILHTQAPAQPQDDSGN